MMMSQLKECLQSQHEQLKAKDKLSKQAASYTNSRKPNQTTQQDSLSKVQLGENYSKSKPANMKVHSKPNMQISLDSISKNKITSNQKCLSPSCKKEASSDIYCSDHQQRLCFTQKCFEKATQQSIYCGRHEREYTKPCGMKSCCKRVSNEEGVEYCYEHRSSANGLIGRKRPLTKDCAGSERLPYNWMEMEDIFLLGVVFEQLLSKGTLEGIWKAVQKSYKLSWSRYVALNPQKRGHYLTGATRKEDELERHFKELALMNTLSGAQNFSQMVCEWELRYNIKGCLVGQENCPLSDQELLTFYSIPTGWSVFDDAFLVAAVVDKFLKTGCIGNDMIAWTMIKTTYDSYILAFSNYTASMNMNTSHTPRMVQALLVRFNALREVNLLRFCYQQWRSSYQALVFMGLIQVQGNGVVQNQSLMSTHPNEDLKKFIHNGVNIPEKFPRTNGSPIQTYPSTTKVNKEKSDLLHLLEEAAKVEKKNSTLHNGKKRSKKNRQAPPRTERETNNSWKEKRNRWREEDEVSLWKGIEEHGNAWSAISQVYLRTRTHHQVKDKGKRLLRSEGWITGRSRESSIQACERAKKIATRVLRERFNEKIALRAS